MQQPVPCHHDPKGVRDRPHPPRAPKRERREARQHNNGQHESREPNAKRERGQGQEGKPRAHGADHRVIDGKEVRQRFVHHVNAERDAQGHPGGAEMDHAVPHRTAVATITPMNSSNAQSKIVAARLPFFISCTKSMCGKCRQDTAHKVETERASSSGRRSLLNRRTPSGTPVRSAVVHARRPGNARDTPGNPAPQLCGVPRAPAGSGTAGPHPASRISHPVQSPVAYPVSTYGASCTTAVLRRDKTSHHSRSDVTIKTVTMVMNSSATNVFTRSLKINRAVSGLADPASDAACARNPSRGSAENTFCHPAVIVTITSQASGVAVTQANRPRPILMRIVVPTHNATAASS